MRATGATTAQLGAATLRFLAAQGPIDAALLEPSAAQIVESLAAHIVPPGWRIVDAEDLAALGRVLADATALGESYHTQPGDLDRLAALVEGS